MSLNSTLNDNSIILTFTIFLAIFFNSNIIQAEESSQLGIYISGKSYDETDFSGNAFMGQSGFMIGLSGRTDEIEDKFYFGSKGRIGYGQVDYTSADTGTMDGISDYHIEGSFFGGPVFGNKDQHALFIGLGGRYLYNASGYMLSSTGHAGYDRISRYLYVPIGIRSTNVVGKEIRVFTIEYDYFLQGIQESKLSQVSSSYNDITNSQENGYGIKITAGFFNQDLNLDGYEFYLDLWEIDDSKPSAGFYEPKNTTTEFGVRYYF